MYITNFNIYILHSLKIFFSLPGIILEEKMTVYFGASLIE